MNLLSARSISLDITFNGLKTMYFVVKNCTYTMGDPGEMQMGGGKLKGNSSRFCRRCLNIFLLYFFVGLETRGGVAPADC
jgi:hypothetical protein